MFTVAEIIGLLPDARIEGKTDRGFTALSTDSRQIKPGELFIPLKGENFNGAKFIPEVLKRGGAALFVKDGLKGLQVLPAAKRNIAKAKAEIFDFLRRTDYAVINQDDEYFERLKERAKASGAKVVTFGLLEKADIGTKELSGIELPVPGEHNIYNALAAIAAARILKVKRSSIAKGLSTVPLSSRRMHVFNFPD